MTRALIVDQIGSDHSIELTQLSLDELGNHEVLIEVAYSSLNYKDAMAVTGRPGILREYPMVPGIDAVGTVLESRDAAWPQGSRVQVNGWGIGESRHGGYADRLQVPARMLTAVPETLTLLEAASLGTAGFTAALSVLALRDARLPEGEVLVTGSTGGVGSIAIALLAAGGEQVVAATGKPEHSDWLRRLGAREIIGRDELAPGKPLQSERWAGAVDSAGGGTLAAIIAQLRYGGTVAACGLADSTALETTVLPFILRGVQLRGINSVLAPAAQREAAWALLAELIDRELLAEQTTVISLDQVAASAEEVMASRHHGRFVVELRGE